ncbi:hypothetical protein [Sphingomonas sp.]|uniref:hypothetical protein n=1 Tax=Sphingomonas sp. TaxID=28214 RepID=UPI0025D42F2B|nr:hypothetical protein [Sphingomonas sp.]
MPYDHQYREAPVRPWEIHSQDREFAARATHHLDPVEIVIGCQLQSRWARATSADPRFR